MNKKRRLRLDILGNETLCQLISPNTYRYELSYIDNSSIVPYDKACVKFSFHYEQLFFYTDSLDL